VSAPIIPSPASIASVGSRLSITVLRNYGTIILLVVLFILFSLTTTNFLTWGNLQDVLLDQAVTACITLGIMIPLIVGEFDLSAGYGVGFISMLGADLALHGASPFVITIAMLGAGIVIGLVNGLFAVKAGISSFIATLGTGIVLEGLTEGLSGGSVLSTNIPHLFVTLGQTDVFGLAWAVWITLILAIVLFYLLEHTPVGRSLYAVGGSERVAFLAGLRTNRLKWGAFVLSGLLVAVAAIFALGQNGSASPSFGSSLLLPAYAAAFVGVTTYRGGYYNVVGSIVGIVLLAIGFNGLSLWGVAFWVQPVFDGAVLLVAVLAANAETRKVRVGS
jgi:ribose transport system permease protein